MSLRSRLIRLAQANPELREHLLPLVTAGYDADIRRISNPATRTDYVAGQLGALVTTVLMEHKGGKRTLSKKDQKAIFDCADQVRKAVKDAFTKVQK